MGDALLRQFAAASDPEQAQALLEQLIVDHGLPTIRKIVAYKLATYGAHEAQDIEDVCSDVVVELIARLQAKPGSISDFDGYTAVAAFHGCNEYLRRKYPNRHRLKNRLRYLLNNEKALGVWEGGVELYCGLRKWLVQARAPASPEALRKLRDSLPLDARLPPAAQVAEVFRRLGAPVELDELVSIMGRVWGVEDITSVPESAAAGIASQTIDPGVKLDLQRWMAELWTQIGELPHPQRVALLLNLRSGSSSNAAAVALLPLTGVATMRQIAEALGLLPEELARLWNRLPLDDLEIADRLGITRQQVINLRKSARDRLTRRLGNMDFVRYR